MASTPMTKAGNILQVACMVVICGLVVRHEFFPTPSAPPIPSTHLSDAQWTATTSNGHWIGKPDAPAKIVMFADFQCPACRDFELRTIPGLKEAFGDKVAVLFRHMPLPYHDQAYRAAIASECAARQGHFPAFSRALYERQSSLGKQSYADYAVEAEVPDTAAFNACLAAASDTLGAVEADVRQAMALNLTFTPMLVLNGEQFGDVPDSTEFQALVTKAIKKAE